MSPLIQKYRFESSTGAVATVIVTPQFQLRPRKRKRKRRKKK